MLLSLLLWTLPVACENANHDKVAEEALKFAHQVHPKESRERISTDTRQRSRVYIDASISMAGYARKNSRTEWTLFDEFLDALGDLLGADVYKFGQPGGRSTATNVNQLLWSTNFGREIHSEAFYNLEYNPDDILILNIARENPPRLSILVSDGVHSEVRAQNNPPVIEAITQWFGKGGVLGIILLKSRYIGPLYSERLRGMINIAPKERPFYAFVFSPTLHEWGSLKDHLAGRFGPRARFFLFSHDSLSMTVETAGPSSYLYSRADPPDKPFFRMFTKDMTNPMLAERTFISRFTVSGASDYPIERVNVDVRASYYPWLGNGFSKKESAFPDGFSSITAPCGQETAAKQGPAGRAGKAGEERYRHGTSKPIGCIEAKTLFPRDSKGPYSFYAFRPVVQPASVREEVRVLSTRDDSAAENADKTFLFYELIYSLTDAHIRKSLLSSVSPYVYVAIANR